MITSRYLSRFPEYTMMGSSRDEDISIEVDESKDESTVDLAIRIQDQGCVTMFLSKENFKALLGFFRNYKEK